MDGNEGTREGSEDTTMSVQMEEEIHVIRVLFFVSKLSPVGVYNRHGQRKCKCVNNINGMKGHVTCV